MTEDFSLRIFEALARPRKTKLGNHPFLRYLDFLNADLTDENWKTVVFDLVRLMPLEAVYEHPTRVKGDVRLASFEEIKDHIALSYWHEGPLTLEAVRQVQREAREVLSAFIRWAEMGDPSATEKAFQTLERYVDFSIAIELAVGFPGVVFIPLMTGIAHQLFFDMASFLSIPEWPQVLGQCAYPKCRKFFKKRRADQKFCSEAHRKAHWEEINR